jgi:hypothetical protein
VLIVKQCLKNDFKARPKTFELFVHTLWNTLLFLSWHCGNDGKSCMFFSHIAIYLFSVKEDIFLYAVVHNFYYLCIFFCLCKILFFQNYRHAIRTSNAITKRSWSWLIIRNLECLHCFHSVSLFITTAKAYLELSIFTRFATNDI